MFNIDFKKLLFSFIFSALTIGLLSFLTYDINLGVFLLASFGSTMVLLYGYPESPFAKPKNIFFGHFLTSLIGILFFNFVPLPISLTIPLSVGLGVALMILFNITHPPAGGNPIIMISSSASFEFLISPVISGSIILIFFGIIFNRFIAKNNYPYY
tara:strand:- start:5646 stop:6113 length:468 start_codon:yes stop_codon:yes gene_type:complete